MYIFYLNIDLENNYIYFIKLFSYNKKYHPINNKFKSGIPPHPPILKLFFSDYYRPSEKIHIYNNYIYHF